MSECAADPQGRPFFAMVCYGPPHSPMIAPKHWLELYSPEEVPIRENTPEPARQRARAFLAKYYGLVGNVDYNIGRLLDWLDSRDLAEDTVVIMVSDHGDMAGEHGRFGKKTYFEASMRVPFLMRYPRRWPAGRAVESFVDPSVDLPPTMLELCGIPVPRYMQGESLAPLMEGRAERGRDHAFYEICMEKEGPEKFPIPERGVRTRDWLYVRTPEGPKALYDLRQDPLETRNLAGTPSAAAPIAELEAILRENMTRTGDDWAFEAVFPPPNFQTHEDGDAQRDAFLREAIVEP
ncbi:MAG: Arylsulfatase [candidate division BRC1 bacterium ADurb.BinA364]|nr:MAG: Arylsulfatase [candidate division BRC1 bacterium ADurb.BinA364]